MLHKYGSCKVFHCDCFLRYPPFFLAGHGQNEDSLRYQGNNFRLLQIPAKYKVKISIVDHCDLDDYSIDLFFGMHLCIFLHKNNFHYSRVSVTDCFNLYHRSLKTILTDDKKLTAQVQLTKDNTAFSF